MPQKSKARASARKAEKPKETQGAQSARFIETARKIGVDESGKEFESALKRVVQSKPQR
jgi:hypothetical protein